MRTRKLGVDGPEVSVVGLGTNQFGGRNDLAQSRAVLQTALEEGVTLIDTANIYSQGRSEEFIGRVLGGPREGVVLATKFGMKMADEPALPRGSRDYIRWAVEGSLRRLRVQTIDLYQIHQPDPQTPIEETLGALDELVQEGTVRFLGSSNFSSVQIAQADEIARERGLARFVSAQNEYSLINREVEAEVLPECERLGIGMLPYFPLASGLLTGKYHRDRPAPEGRLAGREIPQEHWDKLQALESFAVQRGVSLLDVAIGGLAAMPAISSVISGATSPEQVRANVRAGSWEPSPEDVQALMALG